MSPTGDILGLSFEAGDQLTLAHSFVIPRSEADQQEGSRTSEDFGRGRVFRARSRADLLPRTKDVQSATSSTDFLANGLLGRNVFRTVFRMGFSKTFCSSPFASAFSFSLAFELFTAAMSFSSWMSPVWTLEFSFPIWTCEDEWTVTLLSKEIETGRRVVPSTTSTPYADISPLPPTVPCSPRCDARMGVHLINPWSASWSQIRKRSSPTASKNGVSV
jgi:hypothetical protein